METINFNELPLSPEVAKALDEMGFEEATPIQALAIPRILEGRDIVGQAMTGTGKTWSNGQPLKNTDNQSFFYAYMFNGTHTPEVIGNKK